MRAKVGTRLRTCINATTNYSQYLFIVMTTYLIINAKAKLNAIHVKFPHAVAF